MEALWPCQHGRKLEKPRHSLGLQRLGQQLDLLHVREALLVRAVEVLRARQQTTLEVAVTAKMIGPRRAARQSRPITRSFVYSIRLTT